MANAPSSPPSSGDIARLLAIMAQLRSPDGGCPWDLEQTFATIAPYTIEEAYEVADAIQRGDLEHLKDELGDLLLQVVFHARMAEEQGAFGFADVVDAICEKMIRRHPHVFADATVPSAAVQSAAWEEHKARERRAAGRRTAGGSADAGGPGDLPPTLAGIPLALPALLRAFKLQKRAARVGFDWPDARSALFKLEEEAEEVAEEIDAGALPDRLEDELGDLLFSAVNVARKLGVDPESALRRANAKFERRFNGVEQALAEQGRHPTEATLEEMDALWEALKAGE